VLPTPFAQARYYHRSLNPKKLIDVQFSSLPKQQSMSVHNKIYAVQSSSSIQGIRQMEEKDIKIVRTLLNKYLEQFKLRELYSTKEIRHFFLPRDKVMYSWVVETDGEVTDFISFYSLPSSILNHTKHKTLNVSHQL
jgi:glycylpeptide N-tetradecanoyltransferase